MPSPAARGVDPATPNVARIYNCLLGGKDNFAADRAAAGRLIAAIPDIAAIARDNRAFLARVVRYLAADAGIRQFLDLGGGLPTESNVHEVAQGAAPDTHVVYVDYDPLVWSHGQALLGTDEDKPHEAIAAYRDHLAPGSCLAITHGSVEGEDQDPRGDNEHASNVFSQASARLHPRSIPEILRFFDGFDLIEPGLAWMAQWRPDPDAPPAGRITSLRACVGRKP